MLVLGASRRGWPPAVYLVVQIVVSGTAVYVLAHASARDRTVWAWVMTAVAVLFNPIVSVPFSHEAWRLTSLGAVGVFVLWLSLVQGWPDRPAVSRRRGARRRPSWRAWWRGLGG